MNDPQGTVRTLTRSPLAQLILARLREFYREPEAVFWVYGFPLLMASALGVAFRQQPVERFHVAIVQEGGGTNVSASLGATSFVVREVSEAEGRRQLRAGKVDLVVVPPPAPLPREPAADGEKTSGPGENVKFLYDPARKESVLARNAVNEALQRAAGRQDRLSVEDQVFDEPGGRYIDFLVPGLLGMSLMGGGLWGVGYVIVDMRIRRLLKRFLATPMKRSQFLAAILLSRLAFLLPEVLVLLLFSRIAFGVRTHGSLAAVVALILLGALAFAGIGLLVASRAKTLESVSGLMNLVMLPMWVLSGIFFSSERFPEMFQPAIKVLPLTLVIDALRAVMLEGLPLASQWPALVGLSLWAGGSFAVALRWFRWQ
ncbi:MAG: ABC transporter permease [Pirellulales bacterium]